MPELPVDPVVNPDAVALDDPDELLVALEPQVEDVVEPPPSNAALEFVFGHGICSGLSPGGLSSVAPSGIPPVMDVEDRFEGVVPSGEVACMPGVGLVCAPAGASAANHMIAAKADLPCMEFLAS